MSKLSTAALIAAAALGFGGAGAAQAASLPTHTESSLNFTHSDSSLNFTMPTDQLPSHGLLLPAVHDQTTGLLLPAVQKVREASARL